MKKMLMGILVLLAGCGGTDHSFVIKDNGLHQCWYLTKSPISISDKVYWWNFDSKRVHTSRSFDLRVIDEDDGDRKYVEAANSMHLNIEDCGNGLMKR